MIEAAALLAMLAGATAQPARMEATDIDLAVRVCDTWLGEPGTWADHIAEFPKRSGLDRSGLRQIAQVPAFAEGIDKIPAPHLWLLQTPHTTIAIVTSDVRPMCTFAVGEVNGAFEASSVWAAGSGRTAQWQSDPNAQPPKGLRGISLAKPKDGKMPARLLVFSAPVVPKPDGHDLQLLATEALQLD